MSLTPEDVRNKQFTTVRFKEGYELDEVDNFLDEIEVSMTELVKANADLAATSRGEVPQSIKDEQAQLAAENGELADKVAQLEVALEAAQSQAPVEVAVATDDSEALDALAADVHAVQEALAAAQAENAQLQEALAAAQAENAQAHEALEAAQSQAHEVAIAAPVSASDASASSLRVLELAQRTADELVATARIDVDTLRSETDAEVAQLRSDAKTEAETLVSDANNTVATITREFETQRAGLERRIEELVTYEREYRSRLRIYLEGQLRELESKNLAGDRQVTGE